MLWFDRKRTVCQKSPQDLRFIPRLEVLEDRTLPAVGLLALPNLNISRLNDNQAEVAIAVDPTNTGHRFAAAMSFYGPFNATHAPGINLPHFYKDADGTYALESRTLGGLYAAYSDTIQGTWHGRIMATGGPAETNIVERSLPTAGSDPQVTFDGFGNLYLTYLSTTHQYGRVTSGAASTLTDTARQWQSNLWAGRVVTLRPNTETEEHRIITGNTATALSVSQAWNLPPSAFDTYTIQSGAIVENRYESANAVVLVTSSDYGAHFTSARLLDSAAGPGVDYPAVATGPGRTGHNEQSVWVAWKAGNGNVVAAGAAVSDLGQIGDFTTQTVTGSAGMALPRVQVGPTGQVMISFHQLGNPDNTESVNIFTNVDTDGLGPGGFRQAATEVTSTRVVANGPGSAKIPAQITRGITPGVSIAWDRSDRFSPAPNGQGPRI